MTRVYGGRFWKNGISIMTRRQWYHQITVICTFDIYFLLQNVPSNVLFAKSRKLDNIIYQKGH